MWLVVRNYYEKDACMVLFENENYLECELFVDNLEDIANVEIIEDN